MSYCEFSGRLQYPLRREFCLDRSYQLRSRYLLLEVLACMAGALLLPLSKVFVNLMIKDSAELQKLVHPDEDSSAPDFYAGIL